MRARCERDILSLGKENFVFQPRRLLHGFNAGKGNDEEPAVYRFDIGYRKGGSVLKIQRFDLF